MAILTSSNTPCTVGMNIPAKPSYPVLNIAGHDMVEIPGGMFVMGSPHDLHSPPHWVRISPYLLAQRVVSNDQYLEVAGGAVDPLTSIPGNYPRD